VENGAGVGAVAATVARLAAEQASSNATTLARPTAQTIDGKAVGGATGATLVAASSASRAHGIGACPRRSGSALPVALAKPRAMGFFGVLWAKQCVAAAWRREFRRAVSCAPVAADLYLSDYEKSRQTTDTQAHYKRHAQNVHARVSTNEAVSLRRVHVHVIGSEYGYKSVAHA